MDARLLFLGEKAKELDYSALLDSLIYLVPLGALMVSIWTFVNASRERHQKTAADAAELKSDIKHLSIQVAEMRERYEKAADGYHKVDSRLVALETQARTLRERMEKLEGRLNYAD